MTRAILTLNSGSSSLKFALFPVDSTTTVPDLSGRIEGIGRAPTFYARDGAGTLLDPGPLARLHPATPHDALIARLLPWLDQWLGAGDLVAVGHRVVHGGAGFSAPVRLNDTIMAQLDALTPLAPLHQPHNLAAIRAVAAWRANIAQIACFDTGFHAGMDRLNTLFALPRAISDSGVRRYGFHGLSYRHIANILPDHLGAQANGRVIVAHLGNGASLCAMQNRRSVATTMGFTALDGLMMGRRCGALDPGVVLHLMQSMGMDAAAIERLLYHESGLLGVSGISNNMQVLLNTDHPDAREAVELYCHKAAGVLAGLLPAIGGLDALVFTAGIGENAGPVRQGICDRLAWLGVTLDPQANARNATRISPEGAPITVLVLPTNEEAVVADACRAQIVKDHAATV